MKSNYNHKCKQLLEHNKKHNKIKIIKYNDNNFRNDGYWHLESLVYDCDWDTYYTLTSSSGISFCPCCGKRLKDVEKTKRK